MIEEEKSKDICTGCYGTGKDHGDESGKEPCLSCNSEQIVITPNGTIHYVEPLEII